MDKIIIKILKDDEGLTIKEFLKKNHIGRGKIEEIRVKKQTILNQAYAPLSTILNENDELLIHIEEDIDFVCDNIDLKVVYEDEFILIVNKPSNMIIHPDGKKNKGTLVNIVANYYKKNNIHRKIRFIHRIDKETTGIVVFAKDFFSEARLLTQLQNLKLKRKYLALIEGKFNKKTGVINAYIAKDRHISNKMCINQNGLEAITHYNVIKEFNNYSLVEFILQTGRTHQIRVHSKFLNHPLLGDVLYGGNFKYIHRVALHSYEVTLIHPITNQLLNIICELPADMKNLL